MLLSRARLAQFGAQAEDLIAQTVGRAEKCRRHVGTPLFDRFEGVGRHGQEGSNFRASPAFARNVN
jgi:hypothetical protein